MRALLWVLLAQAESAEYLIVAHDSLAEAVQPLAGARVAFSRGDVVRASTTDAAGQARLEEVEGATLTVTAPDSLPYQARPPGK
jgi:hypothetical protein